MSQFSDREIEIIRSDSVDIPFEVLLITNKEDSIFLRQKCEDIDIGDIHNNHDLQLFIQRLKLTMEIESGIGIAAPQVGIGKNIFLFTHLDQPDFPVTVAINPKIVGHPDETVCFRNDGCLSIPGVSGNSIRFPWVDVEYTDENGNLIRERLQGYKRGGDYTGVVFQHEYDHLQGILFIDKLCTIEEEENSEECQ